MGHGGGGGGGGGGGKDYSPLGPLLFFKGPLKDPGKGLIVDGYGLFPWQGVYM